MLYPDDNRPVIPDYVRDLVAGEAAGSIGALFGLTSDKPDAYSALMRSPAIEQATQALIAQVKALSADALKPMLEILQRPAMLDLSDMLQRANDQISGWNLPTITPEQIAADRRRFTRAIRSLAHLKRDLWFIPETRWAPDLSVWARPTPTAFLRELRKWLDANRVELVEETREMLAPGSAAFEHALRCARNPDQGFVIGQWINAVTLLIHEVTGDQVAEPFNLRRLTPDERLAEILAAAGIQADAQTTRRLTAFIHAATRRTDDPAPRITGRHFVAHPTAENVRKFAASEEDHARRWTLFYLAVAYEYAKTRDSSAA